MLSSVTNVYTRRLLDTSSSLCILLIHAFPCFKRVHPTTVGHVTFSLHPLDPCYSVLQTCKPLALVLQTCTLYDCWTRQVLSASSWSFAILCYKPVHSTTVGRVTFSLHPLDWTRHILCASSWLDTSRYLCILLIHAFPCYKRVLKDRPFILTKALILFFPAWSGCNQCRFQSVKQCRRHFAFCILSIFYCSCSISRG